MQNTVKVTRERRYMSDCSAVNGILPELLKFLKLLTARLVSAAKLHGCAVTKSQSKPLTERKKYVLQY